MDMSSDLELFKWPEEAYRDIDFFFCFIVIILALRKFLNSKPQIWREKKVWNIYLQYL